MVPVWGAGSRKGGAVCAAVFISLPSQGRDATVYRIDSGFGYKVGKTLVLALAEDETVSLVEGVVGRGHDLFTGL